MKRLLILSSIALLYASLGWAQDTPAQPQQPTAQTSDQSPATNSDNANANSGTIEGCLNGSDGNYVLTQDSTGTVFKLAGSTDMLKEHVGHKVAITGRVVSDSGSAGSSSDKTNPSSGSAQANASGTSTLQVSDVKMVSKSCSSTNNPYQPR